MKQLLISIGILVVVAIIGYWLLSNNTAEAPAAVPTDGGEQSEEPAAADVGDVPTEPVTSETGYVGLTEVEAEALAEENDVLFRVVERDGEEQIVTKDYRPGRINAVVEGGVVVSYTIEGTEMDKGGDAGAHDAIIGMTIAEAEAYTEENAIPFRIGSVDGEGQPVTMDYRSGRITASVVDGVVTDYSVE